MKKTIYLILAFCVIFQFIAKAQLQVNPQIGVIFQDLTSPPEGTDYKANVGYQAGVDFRIGGRFQLQPGLFYTNTNVSVDYSNPDSILVNDDLLRTNLKIKLLGGFDIIKSGLFKVRLVAGPTYSYLLSANSKDDNIDLEKSDFNSGSVNLDAALGIDIWFISTEIGYSYGFTDAFNSNNGISENSKNASVYFNIGFLLGNGMKKK